jgi:hypothetical protein
MRIDELKRAKDERPFRPFLIHMADGREITVLHSDAVAWDNPRIAICATPGGWEVIDVALITSLAMRNEGEPGTGTRTPRKRKRKGGE